MGRAPTVPDVIEKEIVQDPIEVDITPKQAETLGLIQKPAKKPRSEKQIEATKKLVEKNKAWREKLKAEKNNPDNMVQGLLADTIKGDDDSSEKPKKTRIRYKIKKPTVHPRPNHALKRKKKETEVEESDVGATSEVAETGADTDAIVEELRSKVFGGPARKKFVSAF
jgi:hypothetical protein